MFLAGTLLLASLAPALAADPPPAASPPPAARRVAVIVGIGTWAKLPRTLDLPEGSQQARELAQVLEADAAFDKVHLVLDDLATRSALEGLLLQTLPAQLGPQDTLLVYWVGHGLGADFGEPLLLPYDADPARIQDTAMSVRELGSRLSEVLDVATLALVTDVSHPGSLDGLALVGPNARTWPASPGNLFVLSSASAQEVPANSTFALHFREGIRGMADTSGDHVVSAGEISRYVHDHVVLDSGGRIHPLDGGSFKPESPLATVKPGNEPPDWVDPRLVIRKKRRVMGGICLGAAAVLGGGSAVFYRQGLTHEAAYFGTEPVPDSSSWNQEKGAYEQAFWLHTGLLAGAGVATAAGATLFLLPTPTVLDGPGFAAGLTLPF